MVRPGLLISVRNASEALAALAGGANVIDVKEPSRGPLGAADMSAIAAVVRAVNGRAPVTAALGELIDLMRDAGKADRMIPCGVSLIKIGLAGCRENMQWPALWRAAIESLTHGGGTRAARPVAVVYADWRAAAAPAPGQVLISAIDVGCPALLVDTCVKSSGSLFDHWPVSELSVFITEVQSHGIAVVLAGSLGIDAISTAVSLAPDLVAVRTAACEGGRNGTVVSQRVKTLQAAMGAAAAATIASPHVQNGRAATLSLGDFAPKLFARNG